MAIEYNQRMAGHQLSTYECTELLRAACRMLDYGPVRSITAVSVTCPIRNVAGMVQEVESQGKLLAEEYCLRAEVHRGEYAVTVRFSRP